MQAGIKFNFSEFTFVSDLIFSSPGQRPCELLPSGFVCPSSVSFSHFNFPQKPLSQFRPNFAGMVLGWPPFKSLSNSHALHLRWRIMGGEMGGKKGRVIGEEKGMG